MSSCYGTYHGSLHNIQLPTQPSNLPILSSCVPASHGSLEQLLYNIKLPIQRSSLTTMSSYLAASHDSLEQLPELQAANQTKQLDYPE